MRCPKCGYLSFDHLEVCLKCNKNIQTISNNLYGSTYNIQAPTFLKYSQVQEEEPTESMDFSDELSFSEDDEYVDEDLEILVEEEESGFAGEIDGVEGGQVDLELSEEDDQEDDSEIEIDFSQFEDADEPELNLLDDEEGQQEEAINFQSKIELPEELSDMSDLVHPAKDTEEDWPSAGKQTDLNSADLNLDDLDFDLGLDGMESEKPSLSERSEEDILSLDEIDFSETLAEGISENSEETETMSMDDDLDFDLDLGGLSIHKEATG